MKPIQAKVNDPKFDKMPENVQSQNLDKLRAYELEIEKLDEALENFKKLL